MSSHPGTPRVPRSTSCGRPSLPVSWPGRRRPCTCLRPTRAGITAATAGTAATRGHAATGHDGAGHARGHGAAGHGAGGAHFLLRLGGVAADRLFGTPLHDKFCGGAGNDMISLGGGPDVGYGGACGPVEPPTVTKSGLVARRGRPLAPRGRPGRPAPKTRPAGANDNDRLSRRQGRRRPVRRCRQRPCRRWHRAGTTCPAAAVTTGWSAVRGATGIDGGGGKRLDQLRQRRAR